MSMNKAQCIAAALDTLELAKSCGLDVTTSDLPAADYPHLVSLVARMETDPDFSDAKANRWLGWIQACVFIGCMGDLALEQFKAINQRHST